jgi:hypothetical protein
MAKSRSGIAEIPATSEPVNPDIADRERRDRHERRRQLVEKRLSELADAVHEQPEIAEGSETLLIAKEALLDKDIEGDLPEGAIVVWAAQPAQALLIACPIEDVFFGGARGGGKTDGSLGDWISHQDLYKQNARGIFFRRTYDELEEAQSRAVELFTPLGAVYKSQKRTWIFPSGATLKMRYLARDQDAARYQGHQYTWMCFEELGNWPSPIPIDKLRACLRSGKAPIPKSFRATGNPGGVGHNWIKARYIDPAPPFTPFYDAEAKTWRVYIPSRLTDNKALTDNDPDYWKRVEASANGDEALIKAWRDGDFDIVAGGMLDDLWKRKFHVIESFEIPKSWKIDRTFDWGSSKPFSVLWWAESDGTEAPNGKTYPAGSLFLIGEWYGWNGKPNTGLNLTDPEIAKGIKEREAEFPEGVRKRIKPGAADSSIFDAAQGVSTADVMKQHGVEWLMADKSPGSRKIGWQRIRAYLKAARLDLIPSGKMEEPGLFIFKNNVQWIRTVPTLPRAENNRDDVNTQAEDHCGDNTRYRIMAPKIPPSRAHSW